MNNNNYIKIVAKLSVRMFSGNLSTPMNEVFLKTYKEKNFTDYSNLIWHKIRINTNSIIDQNLQIP